MVLAVVVLWSGASQAQQVGSYVTPFPEKGTYKIYVFGDSLGNGIYSALYGALRRDADIQVINKSRGGTGFVRQKSYNWNSVAEQVSRIERFDVAVAMFGVSDNQRLKVKRRWLAVGSKEWRAEYGRRIDSFIKTIKRKKIALYWVGLPIMRSANSNKAMQIINQIVREKAYLNGVKYIDTWNGFTNQEGGYSFNGPDLAGRVTRLRHRDGVHFTPAGYGKLAHYVEREIRRDILVAKAERSIPLAGGLEEQRRIVRRKRSESDVVQKSPSRESVGEKKAWPTTPAPRRVRLRAPMRQAYGADHSKITLKSSPVGNGGDDLVVDIFRPVIPPAVVNHILRRVSNLKASNVGESITGPMDGGLIAMSSITPVSRQAGGVVKRNVPITQTPYYRVLIKGVVLPPKPGRADDFMWLETSNKPSG